MNRGTHFGGDQVIAGYDVQTYDDDPKPTPSSLKMIKRDDPIHAAAARIPNDLFLTSTLDLEDRIREKAKDGKFCATLGMVKVSYWAEYERCMTARNAFKTENVWKPLVSESWWKINVLQNPLKLAWVISPFPDRITVYQEMIQLGLKRMREILELPLQEEVKGIDMSEGVRKIVLVKKTNIPLVKEQRAILELLMNRADGAVVQRHQVVSKNLNLNVEQKAEKVALPEQELPSLPLNSPTLTLEQLDAYEAKLDSIHTKIKKIAESSGETLDANIVIAERHEEFKE